MVHPDTFDAGYVAHHEEHCLERKQVENESLQELLERKAKETMGFGQYAEALELVHALIALKRCERGD